MRPLLFAALLCLPLSPAGAAKKAAAPVEAQPKTAEDLVAEMDEELTEEASGGPTEKKAVQAMWKKRLARVDALAAEFHRRFPDHPLRWEVRYWETNANDVRANAGLPRPAGARPAAEVYAEIAAAPEASPEIRARASAERATSLSDEVLDGKRPLADWEKVLADHLAQFPDYGGNTMLQEQRVGFVQKLDEPRLVPLLEELAKSPKDDVATMARGKLAAAQARTAAKAKPLELKFKALGGADVDIAQLRGKVVLVQFWAAWSDSSMAELPKIQQAYAKLHAKGFEVVGISLDDGEKDFKALVKKRKVAWPNYYDGKGTENPIAKGFGVEDLPALWLVNKQGMVVDMDGGKDLAEKVERLLGE